MKRKNPPSPQIEPAESLGESAVDPQIRILVAEEVRRQLDRERSILRDAGSLALKVIGGSFALFIAVFTIFGLNTWSGVSQITKEYMQQKVDSLVGRVDSETGVKQTLNDLVNQSIIASELTITKGVDEKKRELSEYKWSRLRSWIQVKALGIDDFSGALAILDAQSDDRKSRDANGILKYMLSPKGSAYHDIVKDSPEKIKAILRNFKHIDMGPSAIEVAQSQEFSEGLRKDAIAYVRAIRYVEGFDAIIKIASTSEAGAVRSEALTTAAALRPSHKLFLAEIDKLIGGVASSESLTTSLEIIRVLSFEPGARSWDSSEGDTAKSVEATTRKLLEYDFANGAYLQIRVRPLPGHSEVPTSIIFFVPTSSTSAKGVLLMSLTEFSRFESYWVRLRDMANDGNLEKLKSSMIRFDQSGSRSAVLLVTLTSQSRLSVRTAADVEKTLGPEASGVKMWLTQDGDLATEWGEQGFFDVGSTVVKFSGGGFKFSLDPTPHN